MPRSRSYLTLAAALLAVSALAAGCGTFKNQQIDDGPSERRVGGTALVATPAAPSPVHAQHAGKVVFASAPLRAEAATLPPGKALYSLSDAIYARPYLTDSYENNIRVATGRECSSDHASIIYAQVNDAPRADWHELERTEFEAQAFATSLGEPLGRDANLALTQDVPAWPVTDFRTRFARAVVPDLKDGANTVTLRVVASCLDRREVGREAEVARGTLPMMLKRRDKVAFWRKQQVTVPKAKLRGAKKLKAEMIAAFARYEQQAKPLKVVALSEGWSIERFNDGRPMKRETEAFVGVKDPNNGRCYAYVATYSQAYEGEAKTYQKEMAVGVDMERRPFPCELLAKR